MTVAWIFIGFLVGVATGSWVNSAICGVVAAVGSFMSRSSKSFKADLQASTWQSDDDEFWQPIRNKLEL